jgi:hypothetical protein
MSLSWATLPGDASSPIDLPTYNCVETDVGAQETYLTLKTNLDQHEESLADGEIMKSVCPEGDVHC